MKKILITTLVATGLFTGVAMAGGHGKNHDFGQRGGHGKIYRKLDLSDAQRQEIREIFQTAKMKNGATKQARFEMRKDFMQRKQALIQSKNLDTNALEILADEKAERMKQGFIARATAEHKAWQVLTPTQQEKATAMMQKRAEKMQKRMEKYKNKKYDNNNDANDD